MENKNENYTQLSLFADQDLHIDSNGHKIKWTVRDHAKKLGKASAFIDNPSKRCVYEICERGKQPYCQAIRMASGDNRIQPEENKCGTENCPYFVPVKKETR